MPLNLTRRLIRERRRIALVVALAFLGLRLTVPAPFTTPASAAAAALCLGALAAALSLFAPRFRSLSEAVALAGAGFAGLVRWLPGSALDPAGPDGSPLVAFAFLLGLTALALNLRHGMRGLRYPLLHNSRFKARAGSRVDIHRLWHGLVPSAALAWSAGCPGTAPVAEMGLRIGPVRPLPPTSAARPGASGVQILDVEPPFHIRLRSQGAQGGGVIEDAGVSEIFIVELGSQRLVLFAHAFSSLPLGRALLAWLDDAPGRMLDRRLALIERRARLEDAQNDRRASPDALAAWEADAARDGDAAHSRPGGDRCAS